MEIDASVAVLSGGLVPRFSSAGAASSEGSSSCRAALPVRAGAGAGGFVGMWLCSGVCPDVTSTVWEPLLWDQ